MFKAKQITKKENLVNTSNFILTINTNDSSEGAKELLEKCTVAILNNFDKFLKAKDQAYGVSLKNNIVSTNVEFAIEQAPKGKYFHSHSLIQIKQKKGIYHVNLDLVRAALNSQFGYVPYVNVKWFKDSSSAVLNYISKNFE